MGHLVPAQALLVRRCRHRLRPSHQRFVVARYGTGRLCAHQSGQDTYQPSRMEDHARRAQKPSRPQRRPVEVRSFYTREWLGSPNGSSTSADAWEDRHTRKHYCFGGIYRRSAQRRELRGEQVVPTGDRVRGPYPDGR